MKRTSVFLVASAALFAQTALADPVYIVRPSIGSGKTDVLPNNAFGGTPQPETPAPAPLAISGPGSVTIKDNVAETFVIEIRNAVGDVTIRLVGNPPTGFSFNAAAGRLFADKAPAGTYELEFEATDSAGRRATTSLRVVVESAGPSTPIVAGWPSIISAIIGEQTAYQLPVDNTVGNVTFRLVSGTLPPGIVLDPNGWIRGMAIKEGAGMFTVTIAVTDETDRITSKSLRILAGGGA